MNNKSKNILTVLIILIITVLLLLIIPNIPNFSNPEKADKNNGLGFILIFILADLILIGIPAWIHNHYIKDYGKVKSIWFFIIFGSITSIFLGERGNLIMIIPYTILMFIYALLYNHLTWWKVALTSYPAGIIIENVINRAPLHAPTLIWIAFFIYPYFITKIWENRKRISILKIIKDLKYTIASSFLLGLLAAYLSKSNISPPLIIIGIAIPFIIKIINKKIKKK